MSSLYHQSISTSRMLIQIPGFREILEESMRTESSFSTPSSRDPVTQLWHCFRFGTSLCHILNAYKPNAIPVVNSIADGVGNVKASKVNVYHFLMGCKEAGVGAGGELFSISELYSDDTNGFVKVLHVVDELLAMIERDGVMVFEHAHENDTNSSSVKSGNGGALHGSSTHIEKVIFELVETERKYVHDLERLQKYMRDLQSAEVLSKSSIIQIFSNLNALVDFERKFLIALEDVCMQEPSKQYIGRLFINSEKGFAVYGPFCANHQTAADTIATHREDLEMVPGIEPTRELPSYLIKPIQRVCKFPLLIRELSKYTPEEYTDLHIELRRAQEAMERVTAAINEARRREENQQIVTELASSVDDWKGLRIEEFDDLLLHGNIIMQKGEIETEVHMFLFERILICCKEKRKDKNKSRSIIRRSTSSAGSGVQYALRGRVATAAIEGIVSSTRNNTFDLKLFFKDNDSGEMESLVLRFIHEEPLRQWQNELEFLLDRHRRRSAPAGHDRHRRNTDASRRRTGATMINTSPSPASSRIDLPSPGGMRAPASALPQMERKSITSVRHHPHLKTAHVSPLASPAPIASPAMPDTSNRQFFPTPPPRLSNASSDTSAPVRARPLANLDRFLNDLGEALKDGYFDENSNSPIDGGIPPPLPIVSQRKPSLNLPRPPNVPVPVPQKNLKLKVHANKDIFVLMALPDMPYADLISKISEKAGNLERIRYEDEDGDYITISGDDDLAVAFKLCSSSSVMNIYVD
eukprot:Partr_v1_DN28645_c0_g1_i1_m49528 putative nucleotide exchange factor